MATTETMTEDLLVTIEDKVATLTMNRPDKLNALSPAMIQAGIERLRELAQDPEVGCIVLTGAGRAFCAGGDVAAFGSEFADKTMEERVDGLRAGQELSYLLYTMPKITIAAVNGHAMGAGLGIAMSCDMRFASDKAKFGTAYAKIGFGGDYGTSWQLTRLVGQAKAKELFFTAEIIEAEEAHRIGLVNRVIPGDDFMEKVHGTASCLAHGPLVSFRYMKENVNLAVDSDFKTILDREAMTHLRCGQTEDFQEGVAAFLEKRSPNFKGK